MGPRGSSLPSLGGREWLLEKVVPKLNLKSYVVVSPEEGNCVSGRRSSARKGPGARVHGVLGAPSSLALLDTECPGGGFLLPVLYWGSNKTIGMTMPLCLC